MNISKIVPNRGPLLGSTAVALAFVAWSGAAAAQSVEAAATDANAVEELVVTAERRATNLQDTPIAITAFSAQTLADRKVDSVRDLAGQIPNLSISRVSI
ncbi:MAG TPA: hypothetical protein VF474_13560, partial [Phenylobacterium sp.]